MTDEYMHHDFVGRPIAIDDFVLSAASSGPFGVGLAIGRVMYHTEKNVVVCREGSDSMKYIKGRSLYIISDEDIIMHKLSDQT